jgi:uncharacterized membrane protein
MSTTIIPLDYFFILLGLTLSIISIMSFRDQGNPKRIATGSFWALYAVVFLVGDRLLPLVVGIIVVAMALIAGLGGVSLGKYGQFTPEERSSSARKLGNRLLYPALTGTPAQNGLGSLAQGIVGYSLEKRRGEALRSR